MRLAARAVACHTSGMEGKRKSTRTRERHTLIVDQWVNAEMASAELDGEDSVLVPRVLLPASASADVVLRVERDVSRVTIIIDRDATEAARRESEQLSERLRRRDRGGDVTL